MARCFATARQARVKLTPWGYSITYRQALAFVLYAMPPLRGFGGRDSVPRTCEQAITHAPYPHVRIQGESAGIVPRAVNHIFSQSEDESPAEVSIAVSMSFLQIYNNTIQDLLAPSSSQMDDSLILRENPRKGFYVEGLNEFEVKSYDEAEALVNFGLENRAMAPTLMNITSSRSHTVLTVHVEKQGVMEGMSDGSAACRQPPHNLPANTHARPTFKLTRDTGEPSEESCY